MARLTLLVLSILLLGQAFAQSLTLGHALNLATRQRMLSQRAAKAFTLSVQGIDTDINTEQALGCIAAFQANQSKLASFAPNLEIKARINRVSTLWETYQQLLRQEPSKRVLMDVVESNEELFLACDAVVKSLNEYAQTQPEFNPSLKMGKGRNLVDVAARVRSLSQRITFYYAVRSTGMVFAHSGEYLEAAHTDFRSHLGSILLFSENSPEASANIKEVVAIWDRYNSLQKIMASEYDISTMNEDFNKVVLLIDKVLLEYETLLEQGGTSAQN